MKVRKTVREGEEERLSSLRVRSLDEAAPRGKTQADLCFISAREKLCLIEQKMRKEKKPWRPASGEETM